MSLWKKEINNYISNQRDISKVIARYLAAQYCNTKAFSEFKGIFNGKSIVIVAAGPTVNKFQPIKDAIYIGMNRSFLLSKVQFNFLFAIDLFGINSFLEEFKNYKGDNCIKFIGEQQEGKGRDIPESYFLQLSNARKYKTDNLIDTQGKIPVDIDCLPLWNGNSVAFQALQFALYTNPSKIYLVGCDCSGIENGHFISGKKDNEMINSFSKDFWKNNKDYLIKGWSKMKDFADTYYPDTEIISVNPVGLTGLWKNLYQN